MVEMTEDERLAILKAISEAIKGPFEDAKNDRKDKLVEKAVNGEGDRESLMVGGVKVGEVSVSYSKPTVAIIPGHEQEALEYLKELGLAKTEIVPVKGWQSHFTRIANGIVERESGELCDFLEWEPSRPKSATLRGCKPQDVLPAYRAAHGELPTVSRLLLEA